MLSLFTLCHSSMPARQLVVCSLALVIISEGTPFRLSRVNPPLTKTKKNSHILQDESRHLFLPRLRHPPPRFLDPPLHRSRHHRLLRRLRLFCRSIHLPHTSLYRANLTSTRDWTAARSRMGNRIHLCPLWTAD